MGNMRFIGSQSIFFTKKIIFVKIGRGFLLDLLSKPNSFISSHTY